MNRTIKFRIWDIAKMFYKCSVGSHNPSVYDSENGFTSWKECTEKAIVMQYTGLKDKNGKEIYEFMELDSKYEVIYQAPSYVLKDISTSDIIPLYGNKYEVTKEYTKI